MKHAFGFCLSEVLVSLFITSIMVTTLTQFYLSQKNQYQSIHKAIDTQLELQWVSELLKQDLPHVLALPI
jgi:type II secretory pathway component PulJ